MEKYSSERLLSLDVFRGLTILTMVLVNDIASVQGLPSWLKHKGFNESGMTFVDVVFPAFLFIVGVSLPFAFAKYKSGPVLFGHVLIRTISLLILGVLMVNIGSYSEQGFLSKSQWTLAMYLSAFLTWGTWVKNEKLNRVLNGCGLICLGICAAIFRGKHGDGIGWLQPQWWGILGLIGWAYLTVSIVYLICRQNLPGIIGSIAMLAALYIGGASGALFFLPSFITGNINIASHIGTHGLICTVGLYIGTRIFKGVGTHQSREFLGSNLLFSVMLIVSGYLLSMQYPISKINATPSWGLISAGYSGLCFVLLYWFIDLKRHKKHWDFMVDVGQNPLLIYLLPGIVYALFGIFHFNIYWTWGQSLTGGIIRSILFTTTILIIGAFLNRKRIRLKL